MSVKSPNFAPSVSMRERNMQRVEIRNVNEMILLCANVAKALENASFPEKDVFSIRLALEECVANSIKHGHQGDPNKTVRVHYSVSEKFFEVEIEDEGPGFNPDVVPDPLAPENLEKPSGRGIFLMRHYMDFVEYNERGNRVHMRKTR